MKLAILGINTLVGKAMLESLNERNLQCDLKLITIDDELEVNYQFQNQLLRVEKIHNDSFDNLDYVLGALNDKLSLQYAPQILQSKAIYIDASSAFRNDKNVPLVVPEVNGEDVLKTNGIIANPNCTTVIACLAIIGIHRISPIKAMVITACQASSGAGLDGMAELEHEMHAIANNHSYQPQIFPRQLALNLIPCIGQDVNLGYTSEEMKMQNECRRILHDDELKVTCTAIRVPVYRAHSISALIYPSTKVDVEQATRAIENISDVVVSNQLGLNAYPTPLDVTDKDIVMVGRIRPDLIHENGINLFCCGDQIRKGTATNCVEILQKCIEYQLK